MSKLSNRQLTMLAVEAESLAGLLRYGCGNRGCIIKEPVGIRVNGRCKCQQSIEESIGMQMDIFCGDYESEEWKQYEQALHD